MSKNTDGMRYPKIDELLSKINSKYKLVYAASRVANIIESEGLIIEGNKCEKPVGQALEEILKGVVEIEFDE